MALRRQREFAADASHELRTPLTVVRSSARAPPAPRRRAGRAVGDALDDIDAEVEHLTSLVDDLLLLARSDSGAISLDRLPLDLGDVAAAAASSLAKPAGAKACSVEVDPEPAMVEGDAARLRQLVTILVDNAIRHSPTGGHVRVAVRREGASALLDVEDDGPGVSPEDMPHVFERFWRASGAPSGGTGPRPGDRQVDRRSPRRLDRGLEPSGWRRAVPRPSSVARRTAPAACGRVA